MRGVGIRPELLGDEGELLAWLGLGLGLELGLGLGLGGELLAWLDARQLLPVTDELARERDGHARSVAMIPQGEPRKRRDLVSKCQCSRKAERIVWAGRPRWVRHGNLRPRGCQVTEPQLAAILRQHQPKRRAEAPIAGVRQPKRLGNAAELLASWHFSAAFVSAPRWLRGWGMKQNYRRPHPRNHA